MTAYLFMLEHYLTGLFNSLGMYLCLILYLLLIQAQMKLDANL